MCTRELLFQWARIITNSTKRFGVVQSGHHPHYLIEFNLYSPWYSWKMLIWR